MCDMTKWFASDRPIVGTSVTSCHLPGCWYESFIYITDHVIVKKEGNRK